MKTIAAAILIFLVPIDTNAQSDFATNWEITGLFVDGQFETFLELDMDLTTRHVAVHGSLDNDAGFSSPATGSCFITFDDGLFCNLQIDQFSYTIDVDGSLTGTIIAKGADGIDVDTGEISFLGLD